MLFSLFDIKTSTFGPIMTFETREVAIRNIAFVLLRGGDSALVHCPDDFVLYELGDFDITTGVVDLHPAPLSIANGREFLKEARKIYFQRKEDYYFLNEHLPDVEKDEEINDVGCEDTDNIQNTVDCGNSN